MMWITYIPALSLRVGSTQIAELHLMASVYNRAHSIQEVQILCPVQL